MILAGELTVLRLRSPNDKNSLWVGFEYTENGVLCQAKDLQNMEIWGQVLKYHFLLTAAFAITLLTVR